MRIGIDASCWLNRRGFGRYTRELVRALLAVDRENEYVLFLDDSTAALAPGLPSGDRASRVVVPTSAAAALTASAHGSRSLGDLWRMRQAVGAWGNRLDLFYFPAVYTYFPVRTPARVVVTKHDMTDRRYPDLLFPNARSKLLWNVKVRLAMARADMVFTVSENSRRDILDAFPRPHDRVRVVADAVDPEFRPVPDGPERRGVLGRYGLDDRLRYLLYVGGISPHKNLETLLIAFERLRGTNPQGSPTRLVLVGDFEADVFHSSYPMIRDRIERSGLRDAVLLTGYVPDSDLVHLYSAADAFVLPSFYEGFGLPALEAMSCGTPVVVSDVGALPEVVGGAGLLFDPTSPEELTDALQRLLSDDGLRSELRAKGLAQAARFRWEDSARAALAGFRETVR